MNTHAASRRTTPLLRLLLCVVTAAGMALQATARPASNADICTSGFLTGHRMRKLERLVEKVRDEQHNTRVLPDQDDMDNHVTNQGDAGVCLFRKAVTELYVAAFSAERTPHFIDDTESRKERDSFSSFVPSCGTAHASQHGHKFKEIIERLEDAKLELQSDEATLRKVLSEIGLLRIVCAERSDLGRASGGRHGGGETRGAHDHQQQGGARKKGRQGGSNKKKQGSKKTGRGGRKQRVVAQQ